MKTFIAVLTLSTLIAAPAFVQSANAAQHSNGRTTRDQAIHECSTLESKNPHDAWGGKQAYYYQACMAEHGQPQ
jgi:hypothetical protein